MIRDILAMTFTFLLGVGASAAYFYNLHPEHDFIDDLPLIKKDIEDVSDNLSNDGDDAATATAQPTAQP